MAGRNFRIQGQTDWLTHSSQTLEVILEQCDQLILLEVAWLLDSPYGSALGPHTSHIFHGGIVSISLSID